MNVDKWNQRQDAQNLYCGIFKPKAFRVVSMLRGLNLWSMAMLLWVALVMGCRAPQVGPAFDSTQLAVLRTGDKLSISFPGAPNLATTQQIDREGNINLPLIGEVKAAELTRAELKEQLLKLYAPHLITKEVTVVVEASSFSVFVTGAVLRPGKILSDHPITALEAIMEAGGFDYSKANLKAVRVIRKQSNQTKNTTLNLKTALDGQEAAPFLMEPQDIIYVPEKFVWF